MELGSGGGAEKETRSSKSDVKKHKRPFESPDGEGRNRRENRYSAAMPFSDLDAFVRCEDRRSEAKKKRKKTKKEEGAAVTVTHRLGSGGGH